MYTPIEEINMIQVDMLINTITIVRICCTCSLDSETLVVPIAKPSSKNQITIEKKNLGFLVDSFPHGSPSAMQAAGTNSA